MVSVMMMVVEGVDFSAGAEELQVLQVEGGIEGSKLVKSVL
jgi:hypothetical protein